MRRRKRRGVHPDRPLAHRRPGVAWRLVAIIRERYVAGVTRASAGVQFLRNAAGPGSPPFKSRLRGSRFSPGYFNYAPPTKPLPQQADCFQGWWQDKVCLRCLARTGAPADRHRKRRIPREATTHTTKVEEAAAFAFPQPDKRARLCGGAHDHVVELTGCSLRLGADGSNAMSELITRMVNGGVGRNRDE
jgi:hypothetical protein